jgi:hypothetical protein
MRVESVEIYSDATNAAILRHPDRQFPGVLIQGDTLHSLCVAIDHLCARARPRMDADILQEIQELRESMRGLLSHYKSVLQEHGLPLPFSEIPPAERP